MSLPQKLKNLKIGDEILPSTLDKLEIQETLLKQTQTYLGLQLYRKALQSSEHLIQLVDQSNNGNLQDLEDTSGFSSKGYNLNNIFDQNFKPYELQICALLGLGKLEECLIYFTKLQKKLKLHKFQSHPGHKQAKVLKFQRIQTQLNNLTNQAKNLMEQKNQGLYDMSMFVPNRKIRYGQIAIDPSGNLKGYTEYIGPIEICSKIEGKGRGLITSKDIKAGQLLVASPAFEIIFDEDDFDDDRLELAIAQKLQLEPELAKDVYQLYAGEEFQVLDLKDLAKLTHTNFLEDPKAKSRITGICTMNSFGNSKNNNGYGHNSRGLWLFPSYFNHDCIDFNCTWKVLGDFIFVRTIKDTKKGQELLISYTDSAETLEEREKFFHAHDFTCGCRLCKFQSNEKKETRERRVAILETLQKLENCLEKSGEFPDIKEKVILVENYVQELEAMSKGSPKPEWNLSVHVALDVLCKFYLRLNDLRYKQVAEEYYRIVNCIQDVHDFTDFKDRICLEVGAAGQVASVFLKAGDVKGALKWIKMLIIDLALVYGDDSKTVFQKIYPVLYAQVVKNGICLDS